MIKKIYTSLLVIAFLLATSGFRPNFALAAQLSGVKDTMSTQAISTTADHTVQWTLVSSHTLSAGDTSTIDFTDADFTTVAAGTWQTTDFTLTDTNHAATAPLAVGAAPVCTATDNYTVTVTAASSTFLITTCSGWVASSANASITFVIKGATGGTGTITNKNADVDSSVFTITNTGSNTDNASGAVVVETNDVVNITATVDPTLTFSNDDATVGFGTLTSGAARYANAAATGSGSSVVAHTMTIGTNATAGYTLTYNGGLLTSGSNTIAAATITGDADGTPGSAQFGLAAAITGTGTIASGYEQASDNWNFVASTTSTLASTSGTVPTGPSIAVRYLANIPASQPAGSYSTNLTYVVTGNF